MWSSASAKQFSERKTVVSSTFVHADVPAVSFSSV